MDLAVLIKEEKIMKKKLTLFDLLVYMIIAVPPAYLALKYAAMPGTIPVHFGIHGPDRYGEKAESWLFIMIMTVVSAGMYIFLKNLSSVDPKRTKASSDSLVAKIAVLVVVFFSIFQIIIINAMSGSMFSMEKIFVPAIGIFFCLMGNLVLNVKPNYFVGVRLPWTLESEDNWRKTHHMAGKLWFGGGLVIAILGFVLPYEYAVFAFVGILAIMIIVPCVFSYLYFKKHRQS